MIKNLDTGLQMHIEDFDRLTSISAEEVHMSAFHHIFVVQKNSQAISNSVLGRAAFL
jgi:hypothetical protein